MKENNKIEYGCLMAVLNLPNWNKLASKINLEDVYNERGYGVEKEPHVTILYGFHDEVNANDVFNLFKKEFLLKEINLNIVGISMFNTDDFDVLKFDVESKELNKINKVMKNLPNTSEFPEYHPHVTIAYLKKGHGKKYLVKLKKNYLLISDKLAYTSKENSGLKNANILKLNDKNLNESENRKSKYLKVKESISRSKSLSKEMKEIIIPYVTSGSRYVEGGFIYGLSIPQKLREKSNKIQGVSMGADKNGFFVYTHRARSESHPVPEKITVKEIEFTETTG